MQQAAGPEVTILPGGLVVITEKLPYVRSVALGISFRVGGRDDPADKVGLAHMVEHMVFKGTPDKDAVAINIAAESLGAELNAFTDKEGTCFWSRAAGDQAGPVTELLCEIVSGPAFAATELEKEKLVVAEEIRTAAEDPDSTAASLLFEAVYGSHPMGWPIAGTVESVARITSQSISDHYHRYYGPAHGVAVAVGDVSHQAMVDRFAPLLAEHNECVPVVRNAPTPAQAGLRLETRRELSQSYVCLARPAFAYADSRRYALFVLNTALGGGVSSRLFQRLREREALVYSISSFTELYADSGLLGIYFVTDSRKLGRCLDVIRDELRRLREHGLAIEEFERARNMTRSSVLLALESPTSRMLRLARTYQLLGEVTPVDATIAGLDRTTPADVDRLISELLSDEFRLAGVVGPMSESEFAQQLTANS